MALLIVDHLVCAQLCKILSTQFLTTSNSSYSSRLNSKMDSSFHIEFRTGRATVESHGSRPVFQMPCERGIWRRIFNPHPSPLSILSHSIPLDSFHFNHLSFKILPQISSQILQSIHISIPIYLLPQMRQFPLSIHFPLL